jgi:hypothetical protein
MSEEKSEPNPVAYVQSEALRAVEELIDQARERARKSVEAVGRVAMLTSGSYNAAVDLKDTVDVVSLPTKFDDLRTSIAELKLSAAPQEQVDGLEAAVQQMAEDYGRLESKIQVVATHGKKTAEEVQRFAESMMPNLDLIAAVGAARSHDSRISDLESWRTQHSSEHASKAGLAQSISRNWIALLALIVSALVLLITALDKLGWIAYWSR